MRTKPGNVLLDAEGIPRVTDFGLARNMSRESSLTSTGQILGTPGYMSPEQARADQKKVGPSTDIYALGAILYCALTGRPPFQAATPIEVLAMVLERQPVSPRQLNPSIPRDLNTLCVKCLEKDPRDRYD